MLNTPELRRLSDAVKRIHTQTGLDQLVWAAAEGIQGLIASDWVSVSLTSPGFTRPAKFWSPYSVLQDKTTSAFAAFYYQHPNWRTFWQRLRPESQQLMHVATSKDAASLPIFHEVLRPLRIANMLALPMAGSSMFAVGVIRDRPRPFSERDGLVLEVLGDHLAAAARRLRASTALVGPQGDDVDVSGWVEFVALDPSGAIAATSPGAVATLRRFFPPPTAPRDLPLALHDWFVNEPSEPVLSVVHRGHRLEVRRFDPRVGRQRYLTMHEQHAGNDWRRPPELTPREAEIVRWVAAGKTNSEIGCILDIKTRTVGKHLESVFAKLGISTRTALVAELFERAASDRVASEPRRPEL